MGKKDKIKKKGKGAEKTAAKTDKKLSQKQKKEIAAKGEDDIEKIVAEIELEEKKRLEVIDQVIICPTRRVNFAFTANPDKEELILFGGEYFNGQKTLLYNDLLFYNIPRNEWSRLKAPGAPPPRCGHQMVALSGAKGQLWIFGGEYASPTQTQFYHYRDLWVYHMAMKKWEKMSASGGPSSRSGHRMVCVKKQLIVFGGFHDNLRDYKYFNDVHIFNLESYTWKRIESSGTPPAPRSGCLMIGLQDGRVLIYGGYSKEKIKRDVDKGHVHTDMFLLSPEKNDTTGTKWKWSIVKAGGARFSPRCGMSVALAAGNKAYGFGGVWDIQESEEDLAGKFYNDLYVLDLERTMWRTVTLSGKRDSVKQRKRRKKDNTNENDTEGAITEMENIDINEEEEEEETDDMEMASTDVATSTSVVSDDGIFKVTLGPATSTSSQSTTMEICAEENRQVFSPSPRMNCGLVIKHGVLYLYGGLVEDGDKQFTLSDFYSLDLHKMDEWKTIIPNDLSSQEWLDSESSSDSSDEEEEEEEKEEEEEEEEELGSESEKEKCDSEQTKMEVD